MSVDEVVRRTSPSTPAETLARRLRAGHDLGSRAAIPPHPEQQPAPLSFAQQRVWWFEELEPGSAVYARSPMLRLKGRLDRAALQRSLADVVSRHAALRTTFYVRDDQPVQLVQPPTMVPLPLIDLNVVAPVERLSEALRRADNEARRPFDLARGPLLRAHLFRLHEQDHLLLVVVHHMAFDGWSAAVFVRELTSLYQAHADAAPVALAALPINYVDYATWQHSQQQRARHEEELGYWRSQLGDAPDVLELPTDHPRRPMRSYAGAHHSFSLPKRLVDGLRSLARESGATPHMVLLASFQALLARYTGQEDILVGSPVTGRTRPELDGLIGCFMNTLVLRTDLSGDPTFRELLRRVRDVCLAAYAHQELPFEKLVHALRPVRDPSRSPLVQVLFNFRNVEIEEVTLPDLRVTHLPLRAGSTLMDLTLDVTPADDGLSCAIEYASELFEARTIERLASHWRVLLEGVAVAPERRLSELRLHDETERRQALEVLHSDRLDFPAPSVHLLFEQQVSRTPQAVAVVAGEEQLNYVDLNARANQLAHRLRALGVGRDVPVGVCLTRSTRLLAALLGVLKAGGAYVPLDPAYPRQRLDAMLTDSRAPVLVTESDLLDRLPEHDAHVVCLDVDTEADEWPTTNPPMGSELSDLAYVMYTSGSTGAPKGVAVEHRGVVNLVAWAGTAFTPVELERVLAATSACFDLSVFEFFVPLSRGGTVVLVRDVLELATDPNARTVTLINTVPSALAELLRLGPLPDSVCTVNLAGEALPEDLALRVYEQPSVERVVNLYGPTETTVYATWATVPRGAAGPPSIGGPVTNTKGYVLDEHRQPVPVGMPGELYLGGAGLARGYLGNPELTAERFVPDPFAAEAGCRLYRTGDRVRIRPDGALEFLGRTDQQVKVRGFRIELGEIEAVLRQHPGVGAAAVAVREDLPGQQQLVAYVVPTTPPGPRDGHLRAFARQRLPEYMVPTAVVRLDQLPYTPNGKLDRRQLPSAATNLERPASASPRTPTEALLVSLWAEVLGIDRLGIHDDFFELGGHSLLAIRLAARVHSALATRVVVRDIFANPTIAELAAHLEHARDEQPSAQQTEPPTPEPAADALGERVTLSFAQEQMWLLDRLIPDRAVYNVPIGVHLVGALDVHALELSLVRLVERHEPLRTVVREFDDAPIAVLERCAPARLSVVDLSSLPDAERDAQAKQQISDAAREPFDLTHGPLLRARLLRLGPETHMLVLCMHHIACDAWSLAVLFRELGLLYTACRTRISSPLTDLPLRYSDYAAAQRQELESALLQDQLEYWRGQLAGAPAALDLPLDHPRPRVQTFKGARHRFSLPASLVEALAELGRRHGATPHMALLASFQALMARYTGQEDILVGAPVAGRARPELHDLIGCFINTLVLRTDVSGDPNFRDLLGRVRDVCLAAYAHQELPFEKLVQALQPDRDPSRSALVQVLFNFRGVPQHGLDIDGLTSSIEELETGTAKFDLTVSLMPDSAGGLMGSVIYPTDLFETASIERLIGHWRTLMEGVVAAPDRPLSELPLLTAAERRQVVIEFNATTTPYPREATIHCLFEAQARATPDAVALVFGEMTLSYGELNRRANAVAHRLRALGIGPEHLVGLHVERSLEMIVGALGILKAGAAYLPLDPTYPEQRLRFMLEDAGAMLVLTQRRLRDSVPSGWRVVCLDAPEELAARYADPQPLGSSRTLAYVMYTSGSSGQPKGVLVEHRGVVRLVTGTAYAQFGRDQVFLQLAPLPFDASTLEIWGALLNGGRLVIYPPGPVDLAELGEAIDQHGVTTLWLTAGLFHAMVEDQLPALRNVRQLLAGGDVLSVAHVQRAVRELPNTMLINGYGPTENTTFTTTYPVARDAAMTRVPIGRPIANTRVYLLDPAGEPVPIGIPGELCAGGDGVARGYLNRPELTGAHFVRDPFSAEPEARLYRTGDLARWRADGSLEFLGRRDQQIKLRGFRIEPEEIATVVGRHPSVSAVAVVVREDTPGQRQLVAYVVPAAESGTDSNQLKAFARQHLPEYMLPSSFVEVEHLPQTAIGKLDRAQLPAPARAHENLRATRVAPRTGLELQLLRLWEQVLGLELGVRDDFFELGGDSLMAVRLFSAIRAKVGRHLPASTLFQYPTVEQLAAALRDQEGLPAWTCLVPIQSKGSRPPFFCVHGFGGGVLDYAPLARHLGSDQPFYGIQSRELGSSDPPFSRIPEMASYYIQELRVLQPEGPYFLGGYCAGGIIAVEIAQQLRKIGQTVGLVAIIESTAPGIARAPVRTGSVLRMMANAPGWLADFSSLDRDLQVGRMARKVRALVRELRVVSDDIQLDDLLDSAEIPADRRSFLELHLEALRTYAPDVYPGRLTILRARVQPLLSLQHPAMGWDRIAAEDVDVRHVPGSHHSLLKEPYVRGVARELRACLDAGQQCA
jgi:amino acid adenylation domain-containing protein